MTTEARRDGTKPFIIAREFAAPPAVIWKAWTDPGALAKWFPPAGFTLATAKMDLRPGGSFHYSFRATNGMEMWGMWQFTEVKAPEKLALIMHFSDASGGVAKHPMSATWPAKTTSTTTFTDIGGGKTKLEIQWAVHDGTEIEHETFDGAHGGMTHGWGGTFAQLEAYLAKA